MAGCFHCLIFISNLNLSNIYTNFRKRVRIFGDLFLGSSSTVWGVSWCCTRGESEESIAFRQQSTQMRESILAFKPRANISRSPKQGWQFNHWLTLTSTFCTRGKQIHNTQTRNPGDKGGERASSLWTKTLSSATSSCDVMSWLWFRKTVPMQWRIYIVKFWTRAPPGSKFFQFHAVFGKIWQNRMSLESWRPLLGEILDPPLPCVRIFRQDIISIA